MQIKKRVGRLVLTAVFTAMITVATLVIQVPIGMGGYLNLGDALVLSGAWLLGGPLGAFAAAVGSALADLFAGYAVYALPTFFIKGGMALLAAFLGRLVQRRGNGRIVLRALGGLLAELVMVAGYFVFEWVLYKSLAGALLSVPFNLLQGAVGLILGVLFAEFFDRSGIIAHLREG
jgi:uncharacterized membrane protein